MLLLSPVLTAKNQQRATNNWFIVAAEEKPPPVDLMAQANRGPKVSDDYGYFRTASFNAFDGRRRTTVFALILICSPV